MVQHALSFFTAVASVLALCLLAYYCKLWNAVCVLHRWYVTKEGLKSFFIVGTISQQGTFEFFKVLRKKK